MLRWLSPWRGLANQAPGLVTFQVLQTKTNSINGKPDLQSGHRLMMVSVCLHLVAQTVKRLSTMRETRIRPLCWEDPLEKEMAIHSSTIAWKIPWTEMPGRLQSIGHD